MQLIPVDQMAAITASHAAVTALYMRERTGRGQEVHVSLYGSALWLLHASLVAASMLKDPVDVTWSRKTDTALHTTYRCKDDRWIIGIHFPEQRYWKSFVEALGSPDILRETRFETTESRKEHSEELFGHLDRIFESETSAYWLEVLHRYDLIFTRINRIDEVLVDQQAIENRYVVDTDIPGLGTVKTAGYPVYFSEAAAGPGLPAPALGGHTREILQGLASIHRVDP